MIDVRDEVDIVLNNQCGPASVNNDGWVSKSFKIYLKNPPFMEGFLSVFNLYQNGVL